ncbi:hypothetical protein F5Y04DRAFT_267402 [Hypomontagnella monticulosa]|nr:hypothetical protein F5Y04DRAFT_267402 [Hypomontagnella monticulosa]
MVGIAGKSQACNTCRQRRVKCDFARPSCLKCIKSKRSCAGYDRDLIFVNRTPSNPSTTAPSVLSELRAQQRLEDFTNITIEADLHRLFSESRDDNCRFRKYAVELLEAIYLPKQPVSGSFNTEISEGSFTWVYRLIDLTDHSKSLDTSLFAFCLAQLHVTNIGNASLYQCLDQYNIALQHLYSDLDDPERRFREETLAAIIVLSTCELFVCPAENGWGVHARGIAEILRLRDRGKAKTPAWRHLFSRMRVVCTLEALTKRQARVLENDIWRQIVTESGSNGSLDEVYQMIADIPAVLERAVSLPSISDQNNFLNESAAVARGSLAMVNCIDSWLDEFWKASPKPLAWSVLSNASNPADTDPSSKVFPFCYEFESLSVAVTIVSCWAVIAQLYSNIIQVHDLVQTKLDRPVELETILTKANTKTSVGDVVGSSEASTQGALLFAAGKGSSIQDIRKEGTRAARYVCQSKEYFQRIEMGTFGSHATIYPIWSARQYFRLHPGHEREYLWLQNVDKMEGPGTRWGLSVMTFADIAEPLGGWPRILPDEISYNNYDPME